jgi:PmbA protein
LVESHLVTSAGTSLACRLGWYELTAIASAREGTRSSSINFGGGQFENLTGEPPSLRLGVRAMLADLARQVHTQSLENGFVGDVVLTPPAVDNLLDWFRAQLSDLQLIAGTSLYRDRVGELVASPLLSMHSRFDAPGVMPLSSDGFVGAPVTLLREGRLMALVPTLYGSRKTGLAHVPIAGSGWELAAGETPKATLIKSIGRGAVVGRLSMGTPAANGDFSGVIKNSFLVEGGQIGAALSEVMISGNMAQMLRDVVAVSRERLDTGAALLPWVRISGLHFS